jgi:predicted RNA polymerase sigma factor
LSQDPPGLWHGDKFERFAPPILAIATAMVHGPAAGLERLDALAEDPRIEGHHRLDAVRAHLLERRRARRSGTTF